MIEKLEAIKAKFDELGVALTNPEVVSDNKRFMTVSKEYRKLEKIVDPYKKYRSCLDGIAFGKEVLETESDSELREMA
ncbi:MAG: PCRF domain-containing protein, partial [Chitinophagaceae bacterium]|nr:PCRF domain-containing protein [Chitinophagaceae bacterium]